MARDSEMAVDCAKLRELLLIRCQNKTSGDLLKKLEHARLFVDRSPLRRMLGESHTRPFANTKNDNVERVLTFARRVLNLSKTELGENDVRWNGPEPREAPDPARQTFEALRLDSIRTHRRAMAERHLAFGLYGQALSPLASETGPVIERKRYAAELDKVATVTAPVRRSGTAETFVRQVPIVVLGQEGVGKTWAVAQWWLTRCPDDLVLFLPGPGFRRSETDAARIIEEALAKLIEPDRKRGDGEAWRQIITTAEFAAAAQGRVVIVVDGLNEAPDANWQIAIEAMWQTAIRWGARLILTSRPAFWKQRTRDIDHWDLPLPAEVTIEGFDYDELVRVCAMAGRELDTIPAHLHEGLRNPRIFRLAIRMLPNLRSADELSIDRLLDAYWQQRLRDRPDLFQLDPDRVVLLRGLAEHAREFHDRRVQAASKEQHDLSADDVAYDLDELLQRFPGLERYRRLDGDTASLLIGEIREGRFFDADPRTPSETYLFRKESLAFALGLFLVEELKRLRQERLDLVHLRERLDSLLEPVLDFDQTADQVMAALTIACRDREDLFAGLFLDQFLALRNQPYRMKPVLCGIAVQAPAVFCAGAERALEVGKVEKINPWLVAALGEMICAGAGLATCGSWIVSPTAGEAGLFGDSFAPVPNVARAIARETLAAMLLAGRKIAPLAGALHQWALLMTSRRPFSRAGITDVPIGQTPIARLVRFNDQDPEDLALAILDLATPAAASPENSGTVATALLLALIADPDSLAHAEELAPGMAALIDPTEPEPDLDWKRAADPDVNIGALNGLLSALSHEDDPAEKDPYHPDREAQRALAARCDPVLFFDLLGADLLTLLHSDPSDELPPNVRAQRLSWLAQDAASAIAMHCADDIDHLTAMLRVVRAGRSRQSTDELEQVLETALAIAPERAGQLLFSLPPEALKPRRLDEPATLFWRPRMPASAVVEVMDAAYRTLTSDDQKEVGQGLQVLHLMTDFDLDPTSIEAIPLPFDDIFKPGEVFDDLRQTLFAIVANCDAQGLMKCLIRTGWFTQQEPLRPLWVDAWVLRTLVNNVPISEIATLIDRRALPAGAATVSDKELPILCRMIEQAIRDDRAAEMHLPDPVGARRILIAGSVWISEHLGWLKGAAFRLVEGFPVGINSFAASVMAEMREPLDGAADYLAAVLRLVRIRADEPSRLLFGPTLAAALSEADRRRELLDLLILGATEDKALAEIVQQAGRIGPAALNMLGDYATQLRSSGRTVRITFGLALGNLLGDGDTAGAYVPLGPSYLRNVQSAHQHARLRSEWALYWAHRRLERQEPAAEYLALAFPSAPLPGSADGLPLLSDATDLDRLFLYRFRRKAANWNEDSLFGEPKPPQWITARAAN